jgi:histidine triad (HIT) family protein
VWPSPRHSSGSSQLANENPTAQRLIQQCHRSTGTDQPCRLLKPCLSCGLHDFWLDVFTEAGANAGQTTFRRFLLAVDKVNCELREHHRMVAEHSISPEISGATIQQVRDRARLPTGRAGWSDRAWPAWRCIRRGAHVGMIIELTFDDDRSVLGILNLSGSASHMWRCTSLVPVTDDVFCQIGRGDLDAAIVLRSDDMIAFLDHRPVFKGHVLIAPLQHVETLLDLPHNLMEPLLTSAQRVARALVEALAAQGTFVAINNVVSQSVPHLHVHVVPRRRGDGLRGFFWPRTRYGAGEMEEYATKIKKAIGYSDQAR